MFTSSLHYLSSQALVWQCLNQQPKHISLTSWAKTKNTVSTPRITQPQIPEILSQEFLLHAYYYFYHSNFCSYSLQDSCFYYSCFHTTSKMCLNTKNNP